MGVFIGSTNPAALELSSVQKPESTRAPIVRFLDKEYPHC
jgi:hypothetical protein